MHLNNQHFKESVRKIRADEDDDDVDYSDDTFEGDILGVLPGSSQNGVQSRPIANRDKRWPNGVIPYQIVFNLLTLVTIRSFN